MLTSLTYRLNKRYLPRLIYIVISIISVISAGFYFRALLYSNQNRHLAGFSIADSIMVKNLNKKAFDHRLTDPTKTIHLSDSALKISKAINYLPGKAEAFRVKGIGYAYQHSIKLSVQNYLEALQYFKETGNKKYQAKVYINIGNLYKNLDRKKARDYFYKSLAISGELNDEELNASIFFSIATAYPNEEYKKALAYFDKSYEIFKKRKDTTNMIMYFQSSGVVLWRLNKLKEAEPKLVEGARLAKERDLYTIITGCYSPLADIYIKKGEYSKAEKIAKQGILYARISKDDIESLLLYRLYEIEVKRKNFQKASEYLHSVYKFESTDFARREADNISINTQHFIQQQKLQAKELTITKQRYRETMFFWIITSIIALLLFAIIIGIVTFFMLQKKRERKEVEIQSNIATLEQMALQAMMNPHFVFNVINSVQHFINQADSLSANQILTGFARLVRKHLEICMKSSISVQEEIIYLNLYLSLEKTRFIDKMNYTITIDPNIDTEDIIIPSLLIQPFIENAIWHGIMPLENGGNILLDLKLHNDQLVITIKDNGVGILNSLKNKAAGHISHGMKLIRDRVNLLNKLNKRHIFIDQKQMGDSGTEILITIPA